MAETLAAGAVVGRYRIESLLGQGGMGSVYRAQNLDTGAYCAVKTMHAVIAEKPEWRKRFLREARAAMAVGHPSIVQIHEVFEHAGTPMLAMELLDGRSLEQVLELAGKLPVSHVARIMIHVTSAVGTAHSIGVIHRDLKPDNIFLRRGAEDDVKVLDFGIAKLTATSGAAVETQALTETGTIIGTPQYMSPEQVTGEKDIDHRADVWSIGVILYRCFTGVLPTEADSYAELFRIMLSGNIQPITELEPTLPAELASLVHRMLQIDRAKRPEDLREVQEVLQRYTEHAASSFGHAVPPPESLGQLAATPISRNAPAEMNKGRTLGLTPRSLKLAQGGTPSSGTLALATPRPKGLPQSTVPLKKLSATLDGEPASTMMIPTRRSPGVLVAALLAVALLAAGLLFFLRH